MNALSTDLRNKLERTIIAARDVAEAGASAALEALAVHHHEPYPHQKKDEPQKKLRNQLRAHARQLGDIQNPKGELKIDHIVHECAYEHWHRMLFARFLAENDLLIEPDSGVSISLRDAEELANEAKVDLWTYASRCAQQMLPQIFRPDDPLLQVGLANEHRVKLERLLASLDTTTFKADDALGWVYQFWQSKKKDQVNAAGEKITGDTLPAVTQLFTEHYMVLFLLHNTIGAWHAGKVLASNPSLAESAVSENALRRAVALKTGGGYSFDYLRFVRGADGEGGGWRPAAGSFAQWPKTTAQLKTLDPCCGSGHFLVATFELLVRLRMAEENLPLADAIDAVLRDNIHGLELDARCTQIAAFNLAMAAWRLAGHRKLPPMHIACTGIAPQATVEQWLKLAEQAIARAPLRDRDPLRLALRGLHSLFADAPTLGSLIDPNRTSMIGAADWETVEPYVASAMKAEADDEEHERAVSAAGIATAAKLLASEYALVMTNVPYLGRKSHCATLIEFVDQHHKSARKDIATVFVDRSFSWLADGGVVAVVTRENWLFLTGYRHLREDYLANRVWRFVARLGPGAFETIGGHIVKTAMVVLAAEKPTSQGLIAGLEASGVPNPAQKAAVLKGQDLSEIIESSEAMAAAYVAAQNDADDEAASAEPLGRPDGVIRLVPQLLQLKHPDARIILEDREDLELLSKYANSWQGIKTSDDPRFTQQLWEQVAIRGGWCLYQRSPDKMAPYTGRSEILFWENGHGQMTEVCQDGAPFRGQSGWGRSGVAIHTMSGLSAMLYTGEKFSADVSVLDPKNQEHLRALWSLARSPEYVDEVRKIDRALRVTNTALVKVPFDFAKWEERGRRECPDGVPEPESDDPTQWLFHGRPNESTAPLQVAVARLIGYRWPAELDDMMRLSKRARGLVANAEALLKYADDDGIVCIPSVRGEEPAADRLLTLLSVCGIKPDRNLDEWLRNGFFQEHYELFNHRPFIWHIWDGRKRDGFHALINYHKLTAAESGSKLLENLTYSYLGDWINRQQDGVKRGEDGAEERLAAAMELQKRLVAILEGEPPFDIFVRWKPLGRQTIGWEPDINDGVRMNIRPFLASDIPGGRAGAGILRWRPNIKWDKDRGKEPDRNRRDYPWFWGWDERSIDFMGGKEFDGNRWNDCHYTIAAKRAARGN